MRDFLDDDWPDARQTKSSRAEFIAAELARLARPCDPLASTPAQEQRRLEETARSAAFWRQHEIRPLGVRLGLHSIDKRLQFDDDAILPRPAFEVGDDDDGSD